jgi:DNA polymerase III alpha subunit
MPTVPRLSRPELGLSLDPGLRRDDEKKALRLGFRQIGGFSEKNAAQLVAARGAGYPDAEALWRRSGLGRAALERLAAADALRSMNLDRRQGLWALKALGEAPLPLFARQEHPASFATHPADAPQDEDLFEGIKKNPHPEEPAKPASRRTHDLYPATTSETRAAALLPAMPLGEHVVEDYRSTSLSLKRHPLAFLRGELAREGVVPAADLATLPVERRVAVAGLVLIRQRPGSAKGVIFITLEDETGIANLIVWPPILERFRRIVLGATLLYCRGRLQREEGVIHIVAEDLRDLTPRLNTLRTRAGIDKSARKPVFALPERVPGQDPRDLYIPDIVIPSRDFR